MKFFSKKIVVKFSFIGWLIILVNVSKILFWVLKSYPTTGNFLRLPLNDETQLDDHMDDSIAAVLVEGVQIFSCLKHVVGLIFRSFPFVHVGDGFQALLTRSSQQGHLGKHCSTS